ncbi:MAG: TIGR02757 family protein [Desulfobacteraceae bacterium]|nr:TIGR02757 family protein [Desulfobacteraceae bacterium]MCF8095177.1 TIGR02757 family protein [Desulfobacteraceae bacterium]
MNHSELEVLYAKYNRRKYVHPDPLECIYAYDSVRDREIAAFVAAALAYGNVWQILKSVTAALAIMGESPHRYLEQSYYADLDADFSGFVHRFAKGPHMAAMLAGLKGVICEFGSLQSAFEAGGSAVDASYMPALTAFADNIRARSPQDPGHLIPYPQKGSACKRLWLFLRWMVRCDEVDPGGWEKMSASKLVVPIDIHMYRACCNLGFTKRRQADMKTALEITAGFAGMVPEDPVRYDFVLTRPGIRGEW